ncbi:hypothetical protein ACFPRL_03910 [Pseudoclavibacter helvolus]
MPPRFRSELSSRTQKQVMSSPSCPRCAATRPSTTKPRTTQTAR